MDASSIRPWWSSYYQALPKIAVPSGCPTVKGNVDCDPETMRAKAERQGLAQGWWPQGKPLTLETYTIARYITSEVGSGTPEERVAVAEAVVNRARLEHTDVNGMLLYRQKPGHPNRGHYGPIHGPAGVSTAPYGRWAATSRDPTSVNLLLADFVLSGGSSDFAQGADDQNGMEYFKDPAANVRKEAAQGDYWIGPLPGVDYWRTFLYKHFGYSPTSPEGKRLLQRGLDAVANKKRPSWSGAPYGARPAGIGLKLLLGAAVALGIGGAYYAASRQRPAVY